MLLVANPTEGQPVSIAALHRIYVTAPAGTADLVAKELEDLGAIEVKAERGGVACRGTLEQAYRACLWSRVANRVLLHLSQFVSPSAIELYDGARNVDWAEHLAADGTFAVECTGRTAALNHTQFAALKVKDAVVDQFRLAAALHGLHLDLFGLHLELLVASDGRLIGVCRGLALGAGLGAGLLAALRCAHCRAGNGCRCGDAG